VSAHNQNFQQSVGEPSEEEARKCLIEADGDVTKAISGCYEERRKKVWLWAVQDDSGSTKISISFAAFGSS